MRIYEITKPEDQLALLKSIMDNTWRTISQQRAQQTRAAPSMQPIQAKPIARSNFTAKPLVKPLMKPKVAKPKKVHYAVASKPSPKPNPTYQTPTQMKHQQHKHQQAYAQAVKKVFDQDMVKLPKSLQPLPTNIVSPIGAGDPDFNKKLELARKQGEQNRSNGSLPASN